MASISLGTALLLGATGIAGGTSVASGILGANAAETAANQEVTAAEKAQQNIESAGSTANANNLGILNQQQALLSPYAQTGLTGLNSLNAAVGPGGSLASPFNFNPASISQDPAYQAQLALGTQAVQRAAAATGTLGSGGTLRALDQYAQGVTAGYENQDYTQALNTYSTNRNATLTNLQAQLGQGQYGTSGLLSALQNYGQLFNSNTLNVAQQAGNYITGAGNAQAAGTIGAANAYGSALNGVGNAAMTGALGYSLSPSLSTNPAVQNPNYGVDTTPQTYDPTLPGATPAPIPYQTAPSAYLTPYGYSPSSGPSVYGAPA